MKVMITVMIMNSMIKPVSIMITTIITIVTIIIVMISNDKKAVIRHSLTVMYIHSGQL